MRSCVFIDGENLRHSLGDLFCPDFYKGDYLPKNAHWEDFFDFLVRECFKESFRLRTYWYVVKRIDFWPYKIRLEDEEKLIRILNKDPETRDALSRAPNQRTFAQEKAKELNEQRRKMESRFAGWQEVHAAISRAHNAVEFRYAGSIRYDLFNGQFGQEKAVDVKLAVDLLELADIYDTAIIVSGDGDYVPVVQAVKNRGKRVVNVSFGTRGNKLLPGGARSLNEITDKSLTVQYAQLKDFMSIPSVHL